MTNAIVVQSENRRSYRQQSPNIHIQAVLFWLTRNPIGTNACHWWIANQPYSFTKCSTQTFRKHRSSRGHHHHPDLAAAGRSCACCRQADASHKYAMLWHVRNTQIDYKVSGESTPSTCPTFPKLRQTISSKSQHTQSQKIRIRVKSSLCILWGNFPDMHVVIETRSPLYYPHKCYTYLVRQVAAKRSNFERDMLSNRFDCYVTHCVCVCVFCVSVVSRRPAVCQFRRPISAWCSMRIVPGIMLLHYNKFGVRA